MDIYLNGSPFNFGLSIVVSGIAGLIGAFIDTPTTDAAWKKPWKLLQQVLHLPAIEQVEHMRNHAAFSRALFLRSLFSNRRLSGVGLNDFLVIFLIIGDNESNLLNSLLGVESNELHALSGTAGLANGIDLHTD